MEAGERASHKNINTLKKMERLHFGPVVVFSVLIVMWWFFMWDICESAMSYISKGDAIMRRNICIGGALFIFILGYFNQELLERF